MSRAARRVLAVVPAVAALLAARWWSGAWHLRFLDLHVYGDGALAVWHGRSVYEVRSVLGLPFTYPPFAALIFLPLAACPLQLTVVCFAIASLAALLCSVRISLDALALPPRWLPAAVLGGVLMEPVGRTLGLGQVNLLIVGAVVVDALRVGETRRGYLTGLAAGVKVVPLVFVGYYALRREWHTVGRVLGAWAVTVVVSAVAAPRDTARYWTSLVFDPNRVGRVGYTDNQSLSGAASRVLHESRPGHAVALLLSVAALAVAGIAANNQLRRGSDLAALCCVAVGGLLASPISWSHHWIWVVPMVLVLISQRRRCAASAFTAVGYLAPHFYPPNSGNRELHYAWWQTLFSLDFVALGTAFLVLMLINSRSDNWASGGGHGVGEPEGCPHDDAPDAPGPVRRPARAFHQLHAQALAGTQPYAGAG